MGIYGRILLSVVFGLSIVHALRLRGVAIPEILLEIYKADLLTTCKLRDVSSYSPDAIYSTRDGAGSVFFFNMTSPVDFISSGLLVLHIESSNPRTKFEVLINGKPELLQMRRINESLVTSIDVIKHKFQLTLTFKKEDISDLDCRFDEIFILTNIDEDCPHWKSFEETSTHKRHTRGVNDSPTENDVKSSLGGCSVKPMKVKFDELGFVTANKILYPREFNMGMCSGRCRLDQCSAHGMLRQIIKGDKRSSLASDYYKMSSPNCVPVGLKSLQIVSVNHTSGKLELGHLEDFVVSECGCL